MICLQTGQMKVNDIEDQLVSWTTWFVTPEGTHPTLDEARKSCEKIGYPFHLIRPVPVALGSKIYEIVNW